MGASINENKRLDIFRSLNEALDSGNIDLALSQMQQLRELRNAFPDDEKVRELLAMGLFSSIHFAGNAGNIELSKCLLDELRNLKESFPDDEKVREQLAKGLVNSIHFAGKEGNHEFSNSLLDEFIRLSALKTNETIDEITNKAAMRYSKAMISHMKTGDSDLALKGMKWLETRMPGHLADPIRPFALAMDVLENGEEKALAREPEEVKRVVRLVLEETNKN